jgi:hypothetical protein
LNNSGNYKKTVKIVPSLDKSKENWHIIRKLLSSLSGVRFNIKRSELVYDIKNYNNFLKFISLHAYPISYMTDRNKFYKELVKFKTNIFTNNVKKKIL